MEYMPSDVLRRGLQKQARAGVAHMAIGALVLVSAVVLLVLAIAIVWPFLAGGVFLLVRGGQMFTDGRTRLRELAHYVPELPTASLRS